MHLTFSMGLITWLWIVTTMLLNPHSLDVHFTKKNDHTATAPDFSLADIDGNTHQLSQYEGQFVVLEWLNFRCRVVDRLYKSGAIPQVQGEYAEEDVVWLTITSGPIGKGEGTIPTEQLRRQIEKRSGQQDAVLLDESGHVGQLYGVSMVPYFVVISPEGSVIYEGAFDNIPDPHADRGEDTLNYVRAALDEATNGEEVRFTTTEPYGCDVRYHR